MLEGISLKGTQADIVWAYHKAIRLGKWRITRAVTRAPRPVRGVRVAPKAKPQAWMLAADVEQADGFKARQRPLLFTAPRQDKSHGQWCFEVREMQLGERRLTATLGPPLY